MFRLVEGVHVNNPQSPICWIATSASDLIALIQTNGATSVEDQTIMSPLPHSEFPSDTFTLH
jgi:hypothetical protein